MSTQLDFQSGAAGRHDYHRLKITAPPKQGIAKTYSEGVLERWATNTLTDMIPASQTTATDRNRHQKPLAQKKASFQGVWIVEHGQEQSRRVPKGTRDCRILDGSREVKSVKTTPQRS